MPVAKQITFAGLTMPERHWARHLGISVTAFRYRERHWPAERVFVLGAQPSGTRASHGRKANPDQSAIR
jgi:hypothetical protein